MPELVDSTGRKLPPVETPSDDLLRAYGDATFLFLRSARHATMPLAVFRTALEPPFLSGQFRIFRFDGVPRGLMTWAWLSRDAERRYVAGETLRPDDWTSGDHLWLIDLVAPYRGLTKGIARWVMKPGNFSKDQFWYRRVSGDNVTRKVVHVRLDRPDDKADILPASAFA